MKTHKIRSLYNKAIVFIAEVFFMKWQCGDRALDLSHPLIMGILNVTPDSFSDGGEHDGFAAAIAHADK